jgi:outer membrane protein
MLLLLAGVILGCIALPELATAQDSRIVYIDSYRIRQEYKEFNEAQDQFNEEVNDWNEEGMAMQREVDSLQRSLEKQRLILSPTKLEEKEDEIATKEAALQKFTNDVFGPNGKAEQRNQALTKPLLDKITAVLEKIAIENNYNYILDAVDGNIAYARKTLDITDKVLEELEALQ